MLEREKQKIRKLVMDKLAELVPELQSYVNKEFAEDGELLVVRSIELAGKFSFAGVGEQLRLSLDVMDMSLATSTPKD